MGAIVAAVLLPASMPLQSIPAAVSEAIGDLASNLSLTRPNHDNSSNPAPINRPTEMPLRRPTEVRMPYGKIRINAGTRILVLRETSTSAIARFGGREVIIPLASFRPPSTADEPVQKADAVSAQAHR